MQFSLERDPQSVLRILHAIHLLIQAALWRNRIGTPFSAKRAITPLVISRAERAPRALGNDDDIALEAGHTRKAITVLTPTKHSNSK